MFTSLTTQEGSWVPPAISQIRGDPGSLQAPLKFGISSQRARGSAGGAKRGQIFSTKQICALLNNVWSSLPTVLSYIPSSISEEELMVNEQFALGTTPLEVVTEKGGGYSRGGGGVKVRTKAPNAEIIARVSNKGGC